MTTTSTPRTLPDDLPDGPPGPRSGALTADRALQAARGVAARLAQDALARDRAGADPHPEARLLRAAGLPALLLPGDVGGSGLPWSVALEVVREIATADGSIAQLLGYHYVNAQNLVWVADAEGLERWGRPAAAEQWLWGDAVNPIDPDLTLVPDPAHGAGHLLRGRKTFATGVSTGDASVVGAVVRDPGGPDDGRALLVVVRTGAEGLEPGGDWDNLGQRLSASGSVTFRDVRITPEQVLGDTGAAATTPQSSLVTPAIQAVFGHLYLGIAQGALATAAEYTRTTSRPWVLGGLAAATDEPHVQSTYGRLVSATRAAAALALQVSGALDAAASRGGALTWHERGELAASVAALKVVTTELVLEVTQRVFEVTGARATASAVGLDRFWRNARTHTLHDPVAYKEREVGEHFLTGRHAPFTLYT